MKQKLPTLAIYVAIICFLLGIIALTETVVAKSKSPYTQNQYQANE